MESKVQSTTIANGVDPVRMALAFFGGTSLALGLVMAFAPGVFFDLVGPYGVRNDHYIHDTASFQIALAVTMLVALRRPSWRVPALTANAIQWGLHAISHLVDIANANYHWLGYFDFFVTAGGAALLTWLAVLAAGQESPGDTT
jgi:hypothetical protein